MTVAISNELPVLVCHSSADEMSPLLTSIKGAIAAEWSPDGVLTFLVRVGDRFVWKDATECIPADSTVDYSRGQVQPIRTP